jgi:hypothetical protein
LLLLENCRINNETIKIIKLTHDMFREFDCFIVTTKSNKSIIESLHHNNDVASYLRNLNISDNDLYCDFRDDKENSKKRVLTFITNCESNTNIILDTNLLNRSKVFNFFDVLSKQKFFIGTAVVVIGLLIIIFVLIF